MPGSATPTSATRRSSSPTATPISPRRSAWSWMRPAMGSASARIATRCWSTTAWSRSSISSRRPARSRSPAATRCWRSCSSRCHSGARAPSERTRNLEIPGLVLTHHRGMTNQQSVPHLLLLPRHRDAVARELVGALVLVMAGMALDPVPAHLVRLQRRVEPLPEFDVLDRLLVRGAPAIALPAVNPGRDALPHILAVGIEIDLAGLLQRLQRRDRRHQLHAVVGGVRLAALQFLFDLAEFQDRAPAARTRIARTGAVGVDDDVGQRSHATNPEVVRP